MEYTHRRLAIFCLSTLGLIGTTCAELTSYQDHGFSFKHSEAERVSVTGDKIKTVRIENGNHCLFMIQNYGSSITPDALRIKMNQSLLEQYKENALQLNHTSINRTIFGTVQIGDCILYSKNNIPSQSQLFTFKNDNDTICVITQMALQHSKEAEQMFKIIQQSISILNK